MSGRGNIIFAMFCNERIHYIHISYRLVMNAKRRYKNGKDSSDFFDENRLIRFLTIVIFEKGKHIL